MDIKNYDKFLSNLKKDVLESVDAGVRSGLKKSFNEVIELTPIADSDQPHPGHLKNSWQLGEGSAPTTQVSYSGVPSTSSVLGRVDQTLNKFTSGKTIYFTNTAEKSDTGLTIASELEKEQGVPYNRLVEYFGISGKAPAGMMRIGMINVDTNITNDVRIQLNKKFK